MLKQANHTWAQVYCEIFRNKACVRKIQILLRNSLIRITPFYGPHAKDLTGHLLERIEPYMYKHIRSMIKPKWKIDAWYTGGNRVPKKLQPSTMESRRSITKIATMLTQTQDIQTIHPKRRKAILQPRMKLQKQWRLRNQAIREQSIKEPESEKRQTKEPYVKGAEETEIMQLVARHPEMPGGGAKPRRQDKLAVIMLASPPGKAAENRPAKRQSGDSRHGNTHAYDADKPSARR